jgi:hypothetical protein
MPYNLALSANTKSRSAEEPVSSNLNQQENTTQCLNHFWQSLIGDARAERALLFSVRYIVSMSIKWNVASKTTSQHNMNQSGVLEFMPS